MRTIPGAILIGISTPYRKGGLLFSKYRDHYGQNDPDVLVVHGPSVAFNNTLDQSVIDRALAADPEAAAAEWLAEWRADLSDFLDRDLITSAIDPGVIVRPPLPGIAYRSFSDISGGRSDSFAAAIVHLTANNVVVLDALYEKRAPFDADAAVKEAA